MKRVVGPWSLSGLGCAAVLLAGALALAGECPKKFTESIKNKQGKTITFDMLLIPGGKFTMGSPPNEEGRKEHEGPQFVAVIKPFYLCSTETTWDMFMAFYDETVQEKRGDAAKKSAEEAKAKGVDAVTGPTPLYGDPTLGWGAGKRPAIGATWHCADVFCKWLSKKTGKKYRLPTEAEWEYACRAGTTTPYSFADADDIEDYAWFEDNSEGDMGDMMTHEVAQKKPNPWGLFDMHGNVMEWVQDFYSPTAYAEAAKHAPVECPTGPKEGKVHVARGGAYNSPAEDLRSAARAFEKPFWRYEDPQEPKSKWWLPKMGFIGFRIACEVPAK